jgi:hypothetical protein
MLRMQKRIDFPLLAVDLGVGFIPIDLAFLAPLVRLRNEHLATRQTQLDLPLSHVLPYR